jgi:choline kinase
VIDEPFVLVESDLVFEDSMLTPMLVPDTIAISNTLPWMNGTVVELNADKSVKAFHVSHNVDDVRQYKTVNIYSLSMQSWHKVVKRLTNYIRDGRVNEYYEIVFADMVTDGSLELDAVFFDENKWYEVDCMKDLHQAELMFPRVTQFDLPEVTHLKPVASRSPANSAITIVSADKPPIPDNVVSINKLAPEKDL